MNTSCLLNSAELEDGGLGKKLKAELLGDRLLLEDTGLFMTKGFTSAVFGGRRGTGGGLGSIDGGGGTSRGKLGVPLGSDNLLFLLACCCGGWSSGILQTGLALTSFAKFWCISFIPRVFLSSSSIWFRSQVVAVWHRVFVGNLF